MIFGKKEKYHVKNGQKSMQKKKKIVHTFRTPHGIIITVKTPQYII